jgi:hypothetical protein
VVIDSPSSRTPGHLGILVAKCCDLGRRVGVDLGMVDWWFGAARLLAVVVMVDR